VRPPATLGPRGLALWTAITAKRDLDAAGAILVEEACRIADRLEQLDELLRGEIAVWAQITDDYAGGKRTTRVVLDDALGEARQQQNALRQILATLKLGSAEEKATGEVSLVDQLTARRTRRLTAASD
jgi:hypothetical protein